MAELDYAFVADYAQVSAGKLTAVGASYTEVRPPELPAGHLLCVAGRIRAPESTESVDMAVRIEAPGQSLQLRWTITPGPEAVRYDGKISILWTVSTSIALMAAGLHEVFVSVDGEEQCRLAFTVISPTT